MNWTSHSWLLLWRTSEYTIQSFNKWIQRLDGGWTYALDLSAGLKALMGSWVHSPYFMVLSCLGVGPRADTHSNMKLTFNFFWEYINVLFHLWDLYFILNWSWILSEVKRVTIVDHLVYARLYHKLYMAIYRKHIKEIKINLKYFWFYRNILYRINSIWQYFGFISI